MKIISNYLGRRETGEEGGSKRSRKQERKRNAKEEASVTPLGRDSERQQCCQERSSISEGRGVARRKIREQGKKVEANKCNQFVKSVFFRARSVLL